jgi:DNA-binding protein H-NS
MSEVTMSTTIDFENFSTKDLDSAVVDLLIENILTKKNALKRIFRAMSEEQYEKLMSDLMAIQDEEEARRQAEKEAEEARLRDLEEIMKLCEEKGISVDQISQINQSKSKSKRTGVTVNKELYKVEDDEGNVHYWSGRGKAPLPFKKLLESGYEKKDLLNPEYAEREAAAS